MKFSFSYCIVSHHCHSASLLKTNLSVSQEIFFLMEQKGRCVFHLFCQTLQLKLSQPGYTPPGALACRYVISQRIPLTRLLQHDIIKMIDKRQTYRKRGIKAQSHFTIDTNENATSEAGSSSSAKQFRCILSEEPLEEVQRTIKQPRSCFYRKMNATLLSFVETRYEESEYKRMS